MSKLRRHKAKLSLDTLAKDVTGHIKLPIEDSKLLAWAKNSAGSQVASIGAKIALSITKVAFRKIYVKIYTIWI